MEQIYYTIFNGGTPYKVTISPTNYVKVYSNAEDDTNDNYDKLVFEKQVQKVFVGISPATEEHNNTYPGNTILLEASDYTYIYIGEKIFTFMSYNPIVKYVSPMGNSLVPYPYAIDDKCWVYLMVFTVVITRMPENLQLSDPYDYYLNAGLEMICSAGSHSQPLIKNFQNIEKFFMGGEQYILTYNPFAAKEYERLVNTFGPDLSIELVDGTDITLNKEKYIKLIEDYEAETGLCKFDHYSLLDEYNY